MHASQGRDQGQSHSQSVAYGGMVLTCHCSQPRERARFLILLIAPLAKNSIFARRPAACVRSFVHLARATCERKRESER